MFNQKVSIINTQNQIFLLVDVYTQATTADTQERCKHEHMRKYFSLYATAAEIILHIAKVFLQLSYLCYVFIFATIQKIHS